MNKMPKGTKNAGRRQGRYPRGADPMHDARWCGGSAVKRSQRQKRRAARRLA